MKKYISLNKRFLVSISLVVLMFSCAVQENNTYPIETFTEMHYSQSYRAQEPPRLAAVVDAVTFNSEGGPEVVLNDTEYPNIKNYDVKMASELYRVNCSTCHGVTGLGDGSATKHIISKNNFYSKVNGMPHNAPANLVDSAANRLNTHDLMITYINAVSEGQLMPAFKKLLTQKEIREIVYYIFDKENGLSK
ncbi:MAG: hypothetical protein CL903_04575 [Dehalococcoidia bacterium]|nr:hypothetical protein [Dehalococcoidia bacterium]MQG09765.1 cytochrome c [SAR202 cluster bacterium]|tara:strand:+ start:4102 stop:4677 length:576 start_codon:yes stop_codon:yes gene_type:complete